VNTEDFTRSYIDQLYTMTDGDMEKQVSMYDVGMAIGLERGDAGSLAEDLMMQNLIELKTLAGGIALTREGLKLLGISAGTASGGANDQKLSAEPVLTEDDRTIIDSLLTQVRGITTGSNTEFVLIEELVIDLKTIEVQLLSPRPKTLIIKEIFKSCAQTLEKIGKAEATVQALMTAVA